MSQKEEKASADKWRDLAEKEELASPEQESVDDAHLLDREAMDAKTRDQLALLEKQADFYKDQAARALAEAENVRRRAEQDVAKARKFGVERLLSDLLPVQESLERGMAIPVADSAQVKVIHDGLKMTLEMVSKLLEKNGVCQIDPQVGDTFDPALHEAMSMRSEPDAKSNTIVQVLQKGYALHGRVLRAAMVIVNA